MGRKKIDSSTKLVKTGFTITPQMSSDLDMLAKFTHSTRSAVLVALVEDYMHDVVESFKDAAYLAKTESEKGLQLSGVAEEFLIRVARAHHKVDGVLFVSFPSEGENK